MATTAEVDVAASVADRGAGEPVVVGDRASKGWVPWATAAVVALALFNTLWRLPVASWHVDEVLFAISGQFMVHGDFSHLWQHPPVAQFLYGLGQELPVSSVLGVRVVAATFGLATGWCAYRLAWRLAGRRCALVVGAMWAVLPHLTHPLGADILVPRLDRYGLLEVVAGGFMAAALLTGWRWVTEGSPRMALATGALIGLATASKLTGLSVAPGILAFVVWRRGWRGVREAAGVLGLALVTFAACYLPFGSTALQALRQMVHFQSAHLERGHSVTVDGVVRLHAPWWAQLDFMWKGDGPLVVVPLAVFAVAALVLIRNAGVLYVAAAVAVPFAGLASDPVSLPHYRYVWLAPLFLLAAMGLDRMLSVGARRWVAWLAAGLAVPLVVAGLATTWRIATLERADYGRASDMVRAAGLAHARLLVHGHNPIFRRELPDMRRVSLDHAGEDPPDVVVVDRLYERRHPKPQVTDLARSLGLHRTRVDRLDLWMRAPLN